MPEELRENLILILVVFVPILAYLIISRVLGKSFKKTPDNPLFPENSCGSIVIRIIKRAPITLIVVVLAYVIAAHNRDWIAKGFNDNDARREAIFAEYDELNEDNVDPESGKRILTQAYLRRDYKLYVSSEQSGSDFASTIYEMVFISAVFIAGGWSCIAYIIGFLLYKKKVSILSIGATLLLIPTIIAGVRIIEDNFGTVSLPNPDNAVISAVPVTISSRRDVLHRGDEETSDSYSYYITIDYGDGNGPISKEVDYSMYNTAEEPGIYYMGQAEENGSVCEFELYSPMEYMEEN